MNDGLPDTASFASLTNWGKSWRCVASRMKRKSRVGGRAGDERTRETPREPVRQRTQFTAPVGCD